MSDKVKGSAFRFLAARDRSAHELKKRLLMKYPEQEQEISEVVEYLKELGFVDDQKFAHNYVEHRNRFRPSGNYLLRRELQERGVADEYIDEVLNSAELELKLAYDLAKSKVASLARHPLPKQQQRLYGLLQRRGFPWQTAQSVVRDVLDTDLQKEYN